ncbi:MAG TPA: sensor histidine kinase [Thermoanaerobaculia bacterium]|nr:sensor histidine kinase [Thermoanaerobaculia bacterium]
MSAQESSPLDDARRLAALEERQRLARELHDSVTQILFSASLLADSIAPAWERDADEGRRRTERLRDLVRRALAEIRALVAELAPAAKSTDFSSREMPPPTVALLHREGLVSVLVREALALERQGLRVRVRADGYERQSREREEALLRVALEALANTVKHAAAHEVEIVLACAPGEVRLTLRDDGSGFDAGAALRRAEAAGPGEGGLGLRSMRDRLRELAGSFRVVSAPGLGTTVEATLPR